MSEVFVIHKPAFSLRIAGDGASDAFADNLSSWSVSQHLSRPAECVLQFHDPDVLALDALRLGTELKLADRNSQSIFSGAVTAIRRDKRADGMRVLRVTAHDALDQLRRRQAMAVHPPNSLKRTVSSVVSNLGLDVDADDDGPELPLIIQWGANDLDWIANLCATYGRYFALHRRTLRLMTLDGSRDPAIELAPDENLFEASIESNAVCLRTEATACAWNPLNIETYSASAMDFTLEAADDWKSAPAGFTEIARDIVGGSGPQDEGVVSQVAQADLDRAAKRAHCFTGLAEGDARLIPGSRISITGTDDGFRGDFALTSVEHSYTRECGYTSALSSEPPADPQRQLGPSISLGVVSDTNDPNDAGRVKVLLKAFNDTESDWLNVCSLGAGDGKGLIVQPEAGDNVLITFANENPAQGIVIGGLFGDNSHHDDDVASNRPRPCSLRTEDGQLLRLDDQQGSIKLQSRGGVLNLHPDGVVLESEADLQISAPGRRITIIADKIDFRKG